MVAIPENAQAACDLFHRAAEANERCSLRVGNVVELAGDIADDVVIGADLHGERSHFDKLIEIADLPAHPRRHLIMQEVCHGGPSYPMKPGSCMSHTLLEGVAELKDRFADQFHFLLSNHELAELTDYPIVKSRRMLNLSFRCGLQEAYGDAADFVRDAAHRFIGSCPLAVRLENRIFICHSLPSDVDTHPFDLSILQRDYTEDDLRDGGPVFRMVWGRDYRPENAAAFAEMVDADLLIHGHDPCSEGYRVPNASQVILDSCCKKGCYALVPVARKMSQEDFVAAIRLLSDG